MTAARSWQIDAKCATADPERFFGDSTSDIGRLREMCAACPVLAQCTAAVVADEAKLSDVDIFGFCAGKTAGERKAERRLAAKQ